MLWAELVVLTDIERLRSWDLVWGNEEIGGCEELGAEATEQRKRMDRSG